MVSRRALVAGAASLAAGTAMVVGTDKNAQASPHIGPANSNCAAGIWYRACDPSGAIIVATVRAPGAGVGAIYGWLEQNGQTAKIAEAWFSWIGNASGIQSATFTLPVPQHGRFKIEHHEGGPSVKGQVQITCFGRVQ